MQSTVRVSINYVGIRVKANIITGVAALQTALKIGPGHRVVTILCDSGARHLSKFWAQIGDIGGEARTTIEDILEGRTLA